MACASVSLPFVPAAAAAGAHGAPNDAGACAEQQQELDCTRRFKNMMPPVSDAESAENKARLMANMAAALAMLAHPDAVDAGLLDFVFGHDPQQDLALLSAPDALEKASIFSISESAIDVLKPAEGRADVECLADFVLIPAACHGVFSYGVLCRRRHGVHRACASLGKLTVLRDSAVGRFCRNEITGELFVVDSDGEVGETNIVYKRELTSTDRVFMKMKFDTNALLKGDGGYDFADAARMQATALQNRFCPICSASPSRKCGCKLPLRRPRHPGDTVTLLANSEQMTGNFVGEVRLTAFCPPLGKYISTRMMSRMDTNPNLLSVLPATLHQTGIQLRLAEASPLQLELPFVDSDGESLFLSDAVNSPLRSVQDQPDFVDDIFESDFPGGSFDHRADIDLALSDISGLDTTVPVGNTPDPVSAELYTLSKDFSESFGGGNADADVLQQHVDEEIKQSITHLFTPLLSEESEVRSGKAVDVADLSSSPVGSRTTSTPAVSRIDAERAARLELRRQKNRAAAARSNARRKERNLSLRRNLAYFRERVQVLQGMEKVLREENSSLKLQLDESL